MKGVIVSFLVLMVSLSLFGQSRVDIRFSANQLGKIKSCIDFELRSLEDSDIKLAGQNYRIYFNPNKVNMDEQSLLSFSDEKIYSGLKSLTKHHSEEIDITMVNLAIDAIEYEEEKVTLLKPNQWTKTSSACFNHYENAQFELQWARAKETGDLATAFVTLSEWKSKGKQQAIEINEYFDFDNGQVQNNTEQFAAEINIYPNPVVDLVNLSIGTFVELDRAQLVVIDAAGNRISTKPINSGVRSYQIDMRDSPAGNYFVEIVNAKNESVFNSAFIKSSL